MGYKTKYVYFIINHNITPDPGCGSLKIMDECGRDLDLPDSSFDS